MQRIIGAILLAIGVSYAAAILYRAWRDREAVRAERGNPVLLCALEVPVFFAATLGISDFLLHTLLLRRLRRRRLPRRPGSLLTCYPIRRPLNSRRPILHPRRGRVREREPYR